MNILTGVSVTLKVTEMITDILGFEGDPEDNKSIVIGDPELFKLIHQVNIKKKDYSRTIKGMNTPNGVLLYIKIVEKGKTIYVDFKEQPDCILVYDDNENVWKLQKNTSDIINDIINENVVPPPPLPSESSNVTELLRDDKDTAEENIMSHLTKIWLLLSPELREILKNMKI